MKSKKLSARANALLGILTLLVVLAILGIAAQRFLKARLDLTESRQFTLSRATQKTLNDLQDQVTIKAVISKELPTQFSQIRTQVEDLLQEFEARSEGKVRIVREDPGESKEKKDAAKALGIEEVQLQEQSSKGFEVKKGFFGLALLYGDKKEVIPVLSSLESFEYDLIVRIKKLTGSTKAIGIVEGGEGAKFTFTPPTQQPVPATGFDGNFPTLKQQLEKLYRLQKIDPIAGPIDTSLALLFVAAPQRLDDREKFHIDQFLMKGKSAIFLTPGVEVNLATGLSGQPTTNYYDDMLRHYGIAVKKNVVLEDQNYQMVPFGGSFFPVPYPYWIVVGGETLNRSNAITAKLGYIGLPWTSSLEIDTAKKDGSKVEILASSTKGSWEVTDNLFFMPQEKYQPVNQKSFPLVALKSGRFASYFAGKPLPGDSLNPVDGAGFLDKAKAEARILVVGNVLFATDFYVGFTNMPSNLHLLLNAVDQLALDPDLITIRSRELSSKPIMKEKEVHKVPLLLANMLLAPLILLAIGIALFLKRRKREAP